MSRTARMAALGLVVVAIVIVVASLVEEKPDGEKTRLVVDPGTGEVRDLTTSESCRECHAEVYAEWERSYHSKSTTMKYVLEMSIDFEDTSCLPCHRPAPIFDGKYGRIPAKRLDRHESGVDCLSCHALPEGGVAAAREGLTGACRPTVVKQNGVNLLTAVQHCAGCHNQHWTIDNWLESDYGPAKAGDESANCMDCHMETVRREKGNVGRDHSFPASHDLSSHRGAVEFEAKIESGKLVVTTKNVGAGHHIPTDARHRSYNVMVRVEDEAGNVRVRWREIDEYRLYYRAQEIESTQIPSGETATATFDMPTAVAKGRVIVRLYYCLVPGLADELRAGRLADEAMMIVERVLPIE